MTLPSASSFNDPSRKGGSIQTYTGKVFWPLDPRENEICREDIAHSLGNKCRYTGHTRAFYSVAQHAVYVSCLLGLQGHSAKIQYAGLHHDDSEAYLADVPSPLKRLPEFAFFREVEDKLQRMIYRYFGLPENEDPLVKEADLIMLVTEKRDLMPPSDWAERYTQKPDVNLVIPWSPDKAEAMWLSRCQELEAEIHKEADDVLLESHARARSSGY